MIVLPCRASDSLDWNLPEEGPIFWRFDLGLEDPFFPLEDPMHFQALSLALSKFTQEIWPRFQERTVGAVLYRGTADFSAFFSWTDKQKENFREWKLERPPASEAHLRRLFAADAFVYYFQMLAHRLPDELSLYLLLGASGMGTLSERHQILSKERFAHFLVATKGLPHSNGLIWEGEQVQKPSDLPNAALCFPEEAQCGSDVLQRIEERMQQMPGPFRVIAEAFLTEDWEGVDTLHVLSDTMSPQGERKLKGFQATGGQVVYV